MPTEQCVGDTERVPPLNLTKRELEVLHVVWSREETNLDDWDQANPDDAQAVRSILDKVNRIYRSVDTGMERGESP